MSFKLQYFEQRKALKQGIELVKIVVYPGKPIKETGQFNEDILSNALQLRIANLIESTGYLFLETEL